MAAIMGLLQDDPAAIMALLQEDDLVRIMGAAGCHPTITGLPIGYCVCDVTDL